MGLLKRTYSLPRETIEQFEKAVASGQRSQVLAELIHAWLDEKRKNQLRRDMITGCREMADVYRELEREFRPLEEEVHRALEAPPARRRGPRPARSRRRA